MSDSRVEVVSISQTSRLHDHGTELSDLEAESDYGHPFVHVAWHTNALQHLDRGASSYCLVARTSGRLVGWWPLIRCPVPTLGVRILSYPAGVMADYQWPIVHRRETNVARALVGFLDQQRDWDALYIPDMGGPDSIVTQLAMAAEDLNMWVSTFPSIVSPYLAVEGEWPAQYRRLRSSSTRKNWERSLRKLQEHGDVRFCHYREWPSLQQTLESAFRLHADRWSDRFTTSKYSSPRGRDFIRAVAHDYASKGLLDLAALEIDGVPIAFAMSFVLDNRYYYYTPAFDSRFASYSPGTLLLTHLLEHAWDRRFGSFEFMKGDESYKWQWTELFRPNVGLVLGRRGGKGGVAYASLLMYARLRAQARQSSRLRRLRRDVLGSMLNSFKGRDR